MRIKELYFVQRDEKNEKNLKKYLDFQSNIVHGKEVLNLYNEIKDYYIKILNDIEEIRYKINIEPSENMCKMNIGYVSEYDELYAEGRIPMDKRKYLYEDEYYIGCKIYSNSIANIINDIYRSEKYTSEDLFDFDLNNMINNHITFDYFIDYFYKSPKGRGNEIIKTRNFDNIDHIQPEIKKFIEHAKSEFEIS